MPEISKKQPGSLNEIENMEDHIRIAAVRRAGAYSPNHIGNDAAIFSQTLQCLHNEGYTITEYSEEEFQVADIAEDVVINMCREMASISKLQRLEKEGKIVLNSGFGIENCTREKMTRLLLEAKVPSPESIIVSTDEDVLPLLHAERFVNCWIKRGDFHAMHKEDVSYVRHPEEAIEILREYALRGISRAVINRHLEGDLVKFYGIADSDFFYWFYPFDMNHSKFGYEQINGKAVGIPFSIDEMQSICRKASEVLNVQVYGGDCIISPEGDICIIDFNDWPSFAPCRDIASIHIARSLDLAIKKKRVRHMTEARK